jgi:alpha-1,3-rhamnosyl/mannosyltransferase
MRVLVNQWLATGPKTGIGHYAAELVRALRKRADGDEVLVYPPWWLRRARATRSRLGWRRSITGGSGSLPAARSSVAALRGHSRGWLRRCGQAMLTAHFRAFAAVRDFDVYHEPNYIPLPCDRPTVATIHDLSLLVHPEWHPADRAAWFAANVPRVLQRCSHFLADSEFTRREAIRELGIAPERITRVYIGIRAHLGPMTRALTTQTLHRLGLPPRYLLYVGTIEPRKNLLLLLKAYCALPEEMRVRWPLLLVGRWGWNAAAEADYLQREACHRGVLHLGYAAEKHLPALYNGARALVYPSLYEGFGLPPVEMMACGGAVLASRAGAVAEVAAGHGHLIDPNDLDGWRTALARVLTDDDWWHAVRRDVEAVSKAYTWDRCAAQTVQVYRSLTGCQPMPRVAFAPTSPPHANEGQPKQRTMPS